MRRTSVAFAVAALLVMPGCRADKPTPSESAYLGSAGRSVIQVVFFPALRQGALRGRVEIDTGGLAHVGPFTGTREGDQVVLSVTRIKQAGTWQGHLAGDALILAVPAIDHYEGGAMFGGGNALLLKTNRMLGPGEVGKIASEIAETPAP